MIDYSLPYLLLQELPPPDVPRCYLVAYLNCLGVFGIDYICSRNLKYEKTGGACAGGYFKDVEGRFNPNNASEKDGFCLVLHPDQIPGDKCAACK